jgi:ribose 5-phosphate isomerase B
MKIYLATDHAGFELKEGVKKWLKENGYEVADEGAFAFDPNDDYPDFISIAAKMVAANPEDRAVIFGKSGVGESIVANRFAHVRAVVYHGGNMEIVKLSREHNNANALSLGAEFVSLGEATEAVSLFLQTSFSNDERHLRRLNKIDTPSENMFTV